MPTFPQTNVVKGYKLKIKNKFKSISEETENAVSLMRCCVSKFREKLNQVLSQNDKSFFAHYDELNDDIEKYQEKLFFILASFDTSGEINSDQDESNEQLSHEDVSVSSFGFSESHEGYCSPGSQAAPNEHAVSKTSILPRSSPSASTASFLSVQNTHCLPSPTRSRSSSTAYEDCHSLLDQNLSHDGDDLVPNLTNDCHSSFLSNSSYNSQTLNHRSSQNLKACVNNENLKKTECGVVTDLKHAEERKISLPGLHTLQRLKCIILPVAISVPSVISATLTHIADPGNFWMQMDSDELIISFPLSIYSALEPPASFQLGDYVLAPFKSVPYYYRAQLMNEASENQDVEVFFIDHGSVQVLPTSVLKILPEDLFKMPSQAIHCCLADVSASNSTWSPESVRKLNEFQNNSLCTSIKSIICDKYAVQLTATVSNDYFGEEFSCDIAETLCLDGLAVPFVNPSAEGSSGSVVLDGASCDSGVSMTSNQQGSHSDEIMQNDIPPKMTKFGSFVNKSNIDSSSLKVNEHDLMSFDSIETIQYEKKENFSVATYEESLSSLNLTVPPMTVSYIKEDVMLVMLSHVVNPSEFYVNLALEDSLTLDDLQEKMNSHYGINLKNFYPLSCNDLREGMFLAGFVKHDHNWYRIKVLRINNEVSVRYIDYGNEGLLRYGDLRPLTHEFAEHPAFSIKCALAGILPKQVSDGLPEQGVKCWSKEAIEKFHELISYDKCFTADICGQSQPPETESKTLEVLLWDNENNVDILINDVLVECGFAEIDMNCVAQQEEKETPILCDELEEWDPMSDEFWSIENSYGVRKEDAQVALTGYKPKDENYICKYFSLRGHCPIKNCRYEHVQLAEGGVTRDKAEEYALERTPSLPSLSTYVIVQVSAVISPGHFYCILPFGSKSVNDIDFIVKSGQVQEMWPKDEMKILCDHMNEHFSSATFVENTALALSYGSIVVAKRKTDDAWHRGRVTDVTDVAGSARIFFLDFGDEAWVPRISIRKILPEYLHTPFQAVECHLSDVEPLGAEAGRKWSPHAHCRFKELVANEVFLAHVTYKCGSVLHVTLRRTRQDDHQHLSEILIREGFAQYLQPATSKERVETRFVPG